jgi:hypothetical protein
VQCVEGPRHGARRPTSSRPTDDVGVPGHRWHVVEAALAEGLAGRVASARICPHSSPWSDTLPG